MTDGLSPVQKTLPAEIATLDSIGKGKDRASLRELGNSPEPNAEQRIENLYGLIKSMEFYSTALCGQIARTEKKLAALKQLTVPHPPVTGSNVGDEHSHVWERKSTRRALTRRKLENRRMKQRIENEETSTDAQQQPHHQRVVPFLVFNRFSGKTLGAVYAASIHSAKDIADTLWTKDKDGLQIFDMHKEYESKQAGITTGVAASPNNPSMKQAPIR